MDGLRTGLFIVDMGKRGRDEGWWMEKRWTVLGDQGNKCKCENQ